MTQAIPSTEHGHGHEHADEQHVLPISVYLGVWGALVFLTVVTVAVSRFDFGSANTFIALLVATIKGSLVALYFMHLRYDNKLNLIILVSSLLFVSIFFTPTLIDLGTRDSIDPIKGSHYYKLATSKPVPMPVVAPAAPPAAPATASSAAPAAPSASAAPGAPAKGVEAPAPAAPAPAASPAHPAQKSVPAAQQAPASPPH